MPKERIKISRKFFQQIEIIFQHYVEPKIYFLKIGVKKWTPKKYSHSLASFENFKSRNT